MAKFGMWGRGSFGGAQQQQQPSQDDRQAPPSNRYFNLLATDTMSCVSKSEEKKKKKDYRYILGNLRGLHQDQMAAHLTEVCAKVPTKIIAKIYLL